MRHFQLCRYTRVIVDGRPHIHARLKAERPEGWKTVGIFQLTEAEWEGLTELCGEHGIPVIHDAEESAISS